METNTNSNQPSYGTMNSAQMINEKPKNHSYRMILVTVIIILLGIGGYVIVSNPALKSQVKQQLHLTQMPEESSINSEELSLFASTITDRNSPWMEVRSEGMAKVGEPIQMSVYGFSTDKEIVGYDMLLGVDTDVFTVASVTSKAPGYQIFDFDKGTYRSITGIKDLQATETTQFNDTQLIVVELIPKRAGSSVITVLATKGQEKTQFVYEEGTEVRSVTPQIGSVQLEIEE